ncbi:MAG: hypothetical protein IKM72_09850 [Oscillospiraceae bacterium]|nr:hypothetical protein [Oscillospiraceae bacterium]
MKTAIIIALIILAEFLTGLFAYSLAFAAKHEPPSVIKRKRITVIYNILFNR